MHSLLLRALALAPSTDPSKLPFLLHAAIETVAALSFILRPQSQLPNPSLAPRLILQSLGGLLLSTNLICLIFAARPEFDGTSRLVAASLAFWHVWPCCRAYVRLTRPELEGEGWQGKEKRSAEGDTTERTLGGPAVHLGVHLLLLLMFVSAAVIE
ncbi:hypothetical protein CCHL11_07112 [Colletotrichum chlorophyti]|uniref:Uncharacterized protein n=1 Tax=Colletotrichum chlorophyti TaxID=708187 RepID=A0A1Q8S3F0_9PEZI|nr:hypothetical protein CCHL11_07112 [Colletotrichum chlorophyti]